MKKEEAFLSNFDRDCLKLSIADLQAKYPKTSVEELISSQQIIKEQMSELGQKRFLKWLKKRSWVLYDYKN